MYSKLLVGLALLLMFQQSYAFRCGSKIVNKGKTQAHVLQHCGQPTSRFSRYAIRSINNLADRKLRHRMKRSSPHSGAQIEVLIEEWTYIFGAGKMNRTVTFENGIVINIDSTKNM